MIDPSSPVIGRHPNGVHGTHILSTKFEGTPTALLSLCQQHNAQILSLLEVQSQSSKGDALELLQTTKQIQILLTKIKEYCIDGNIKDFGDANAKVSETVYSSICKYEKRIQQLQKQGSLLKFITQARLRSKIDRLSNFICVQVTNLEREVKREVLDSFSALVLEEFVDMLRDVEDEDYGAKDKESDSAYTRSLAQFSRIKDENTKLDMHNALSIIKSNLQRDHMLSRIPKLHVKPLRTKDEIALILSGDERYDHTQTDKQKDEAERIYKDVIFAQSVSTYPVLGTQRFGDPICDMYGAMYFDNRVIFTLADGCGWGNETRKAAKKASRMFLHFLKKNQSLISTIHDAGIMLLQAYLASHKSIIHDKSQDFIRFECGSTTMLGGIVLELQQPKNGKNFACVFASIGDCKAYLYQNHYKDQDNNNNGESVPPVGWIRTTEITRGNRGSGDAKDPGGRIGPFEDGSNPDLRNLKIDVVYCDEDDLIAVVTDGVHDNLDPKILGKLPSEIGLDIDSWSKLEPHHQPKIWSWSESLLDHAISKTAGIHEKIIQPSTVGRATIKHSLDATAIQRGIMANNQKAPNDFRICPGKLDHTSIICFKIPTQKQHHETVVTASLSSPRDFLRRSWIKANVAPNSSPPPNKVVPSDDNLYLDIPCVLEEEKDEDPDRPVWDLLFGQSTYVVEWPQLLQKMKIAEGSEDDGSLKSILDYAGAGSVTRFKFLEFLKGFGPLEDCMQNVRRTVTADWFHGFITSNESKLFLAQQPIGTFLIRFSSSRTGSFVLDYVREINTIRSVRLNSNPSGGFKAPIDGGAEKVFKNLDEIVESYTKKSILRLPLYSTIPQQPWFFGDITEEDAKQLLQNQPLGTFLVRFSQKVVGCYTACFVGENGEVNKGLFTPANGGFRVNNEGFVFPTLEDIIEHYKKVGFFTKPLSH